VKIDGYDVAFYKAPVKLASTDLLNVPDGVRFFGLCLSDAYRLKSCPQYKMFVPRRSSHTDMPAPPKSSRRLKLPRPACCPEGDFAWKLPVAAEITGQW
jgi:hypothetical protein